MSNNLRTRFAMSGRTNNTHNNNNNTDNHDDEHEQQQQKKPPQPLPPNSRPSLERSVYRTREVNRLTRLSSWESSATTETANTLKLRELMNQAKHKSRRNLLGGAGAAGAASARDAKMDKQIHEIADAWLLSVKLRKRFIKGKEVETFIGTDFVDWTIKNRFASIRQEGEEIGQRLIEEFNLFVCATDESAEFIDDYEFYKLTKKKERTYPKEYKRQNSMDLGRPNQLNYASVANDFEKVAQIFLDGFGETNTETITFRKIKYEDVFTGSSAVDWMVDSSFASSRQDAVQLGQRLLTEAGMFYRVTNANEEDTADIAVFKDDYVFYRFFKDDVGYGNLKTSSSDSDERHTNSIKEHFDDRKIESVDNSLPTRHEDFAKLESSGTGASSSHGPTRRGRRANVFRSGMTANSTYQASSVTESVVTRRSTRRSSIFKLQDTSFLEDGNELNELYNKMAPGFTPEQRTKYLIGRFRSWASSFRKLDPRLQILRYFNEISQNRCSQAHRVEFIKRTRSLVRRLHDMNVDISDRLFYTTPAAVFTVWRPCSAESIKKMMTGQGVGKGLDIKGKSAKRGKLSAFVPFLQISENSDKEKVKPLPPDQSIRIFFKGRVTRDAALATLDLLGEDIMESLEEAKEKLQTFVDAEDEEEGGKADDFDESGWEDLQAALALEMTDATVKPIDDHAPNCYGLDVPARLFWEAFVVQKDISRPRGSEYDTGRASLPAFQDKNHGTLLSAPMPGAPRPVLWQNSEKRAMNPLELLMAYEENGNVTPVVSDFDGFLVGSQRVRFSERLPQDQINLYNWCIDRIGNILDEPGPENWISRWLEVLNNPWQDQEMPKYNYTPYGLGDPVSYEIMENAAKRLASGEISNGAVRHGPECFNVTFPQEDDDDYLVVWENLPGHRNWTQMCTKDLQAFLAERIDEGFTFPINPKWILCDKGWGRLYDKMLKSQRAEVKESYDIWFPPDSGIREKIDAIRKKHPDGFVRGKRRKDLKDAPPSVLRDILQYDATEGSEASLSNGDPASHGLTSFLTTLGGSGESTTSETCSALASLFERGLANISYCKEIADSIESITFCMRKYASNADMQLNICTILDGLLTASGDQQVAERCCTGFKGSALMEGFCGILSGHIEHKELIQKACKVLSIAASHVDQPALSPTRVMFGRTLLMVMDSFIECVEIQAALLKILNKVILVDEYFVKILVESDGVEMISQCMCCHIDSSRVQARGITVFCNICKYASGREYIGSRGGVMCVVNGMLKHPEAAELQKEGLSVIQHLSTVPENKPMLKSLGGEIAILNSVWINMEDPEVMTTAFYALNNMSVDPNNRQVEKMDKCTLHILLVALERENFAANEKVQRSIIFYLNNCRRRPENLQMMSESSDRLVPHLFAAAERFPRSCQRRANDIIGRIFGGV